MTDKVNSRKVTIMFTDMVGYSKLTGRDQKLALSLLKEHDKILEHAISHHSGRIIKHIGDAVFAEFTKTYDAVHCGIDIQNQIKKRNDLNSKDREILIRVGIHFGEVFEKNDDVYGDGVNIASQIEPIAPTGGIAVSETVNQVIKNESDIYSQEYTTFTPKGSTKKLTLYQVFIHILDWMDEASTQESNENTYDLSTARKLSENGDYSSALKSAMISGSSLNQTDKRHLESKLFISNLLNILGQSDLVLKNISELEEIFNSKLSTLQHAELHKLKAEVYFNKSVTKHSVSECESAIDLLKDTPGELLDEVIYLFCYIHIKSNKIEECSSLLKFRSNDENSHAQLILSGIELIVKCKNKEAEIAIVEDFYKLIKTTCKNSHCCAHVFWLICKAYLILNENDLALEAQEEAQIQLLAAQDKISDFYMRNDFVKKNIIHQDIMKDLHFETSDYDLELNEFGEDMEFEVEDDDSNDSTSSSFFQFCPNCGNNNQDQFQFCPNCGCNLSN
jgi:class 3 adenylate cyclase